MTGEQFVRAVGAHQVHLDFSGDRATTTLSKTDRNNLRNAYRELRHYGHDRQTAREWVAERIVELR